MVELYRRFLGCVLVDVLPVALLEKVLAHREYAHETERIEAYDAFYHDEMAVDIFEKETS